MGLREAVALKLGSDWADASLTLIDDAPVAQPGLRRLTFRNDKDEPVSGLYLPSRNGAAVLYCHAHGNRYDIGCDELTDGRPALQGPYLPEFKARGWGVLCLDMPCFGTRAHLDEQATAKARLWQGRTLFGQMLGEQRAARDWLAQAEGVNPGRMAVMGISMGGTLAWWLAAMAGGFAAAVTIACFADLGTLVDTGAHEGHGLYMNVPGLLPLASTGRICGLAAPISILHCAGFQDWSTPQPAFERARSELTAAYRDTGAEQALHFVTDPSCGHAETAEMRRAVLDFLGARLG